MDNKSCRKSLHIVTLLLAFVLTAAGDVNVTIRRAPYDVPNVSSKTERATTLCQYCGSKIKYDRKYRWDTVKHEWYETTDAATVPTACRKCKQKGKDEAKLDRKENELDRKIKYEKTKARIASKEKKLQRLRNANR